MRILITGVATFWGGRLAQALEQHPDVEVVVGLDRKPPKVPLEHTEFVQAETSYAILSRIIEQAEIDTVLHTHLAIDSTKIGGRTLHERNVIGTMNLLAALGATGNKVRKLIVKSSTLIYGANFEDPYFFREEFERTQGPRTRIEKTLLEAENFIKDFAEDHPEVITTMLRFANVLGDDIDTPISRALQMPMVPNIMGFDPRIQFVHESDVIGSTLFATTNDVPGIFNIAGDGVIPWSEICTMLGKRRIPLPPIGTELAMRPLKMGGLLVLPRETLDLLKFGRGVDNAAFKDAGYKYRYTTAGTIDAFGKQLRLKHSIGGGAPEYTYDRDLEEFFKHSPAITRGAE